MEFITASCSLFGGDNANADAIFAGSLPKGFIAVTVDGIHHDVLSRAIIQSLRQSYTKDPRLTHNAIEALFIKAKKDAETLYDPIDSGVYGAAALFSDGEQAVATRIGSTRLYFFRGGKIYYMTPTPHVSLDMDALTKELLVENLPAPLMEHDAFLLCTDSFVHSLTEIELEIDLAKSINPNQWISYLLSRIGQRIRIEKAEYKMDTMSAIAVFCQTDSFITRTLVL